VDVDFVFAFGEKWTIPSSIIPEVADREYPEIGIVFRSIYSGIFSVYLLVSVVYAIVTDMMHLNRLPKTRKRERLKYVQCVWCV